MGYAISGSVAEQVLPILWGAGSNGKSTLVDAITRTIGSDYSGTLPRSLLMVTKGERHPTELTTWRSCRNSAIWNSSIGSVARRIDD